jgi:hypothetical protein
MADGGSNEQVEDTGIMMVVSVSIGIFFYDNVPRYVVNNSISDCS